MATLRVSFYDTIPATENAGIQQQLILFMRFTGDRGNNDRRNPFPVSPIVLLLIFLGTVADRKNPCLTRRTEMPRPAPLLFPYLTLTEFSKRSSIPESTIRRWIRENRLPHIQPGGRGTLILIPADALDRVILATQLRWSEASSNCSAKLLQRPKFRDAPGSGRQLASNCSWKSRKDCFNCR
ncbi:MAG: excisionase family DNA-binding protein [Planctomycetaceae bacterium]|nr:excisionase family DNA-binding protein [Planctomycetaceae bacterium]